MGKYKYALKKELDWLSEDWDVCHKMIAKIDAGENVGYPREHLLERADFASRARERLKIFMDEYEKTMKPKSKHAGFKMSNPRWVPGPSS